MRAAFVTLPALKIAVRCGSGPLFRFQLVWVHGEAHRTARLAPFKARSFENLVEAFSFCLFLHKARAWNDHGISQTLRYLFALHHLGHSAQVFNAAVGA